MKHGFLAALLLVVCAVPAFPQSELPASYDGPAPPPLPQTISRDGEGRVTVRAVRVDAPIRIDGQLDESLYTAVEPMSDFIQAEPAAGQPATEKTEIWVAFDDDNVYVGFRAWESQPERMVADEMRRDSNNVWQNESVGVAFDTFYDKRNSLNFYLNAVGGRMDGQVTNEGNWSGDWNPVWDFAVRRTGTGWSGEAAIPFKSIRYQPQRQQVWGFQVRRVNRWKNETSFLTRVPLGMAGNGIFRLSAAATLVGIEAPASRPPLDIKPYVISDITTDRSATPRVENAFGKDFGLDVKYAPTRSLTADFTYNTDFAQVEADEQQVNLTRFSLFFPEKRDFFLENQGIFSFGGSTGNNNSDSPVLFYSRRIGLEQGREVPIEAGGRLTGRMGAYTVGLINIQTDDLDGAGIPATNFSVARVQRNVLRRSAIGAIATRRSMVSGGTGAGDTYGVDGAFAFFTNVLIHTFWAQTTAPGVDRDNVSYRGQFQYNGDRYGLHTEWLRIGNNFRPQVGFARRFDFTKRRALLRFSPRPTRRFTRVRKFTYQASFEYFENGAGRKETRDIFAELYVEFQNSDRFEMTYQDDFEAIVRPFSLARNVDVPAGGYYLRTLHVQHTLGQQHTVQGSVYAETGPFYGGHRDAFGVSGGRVKFSPQLSVEPRIAIDRVTVPFGEFTSKLVGSRVTYSITPMMFVSGLLQYNSGSNIFSTNVRLRWEYLPGSELFVVYNDGRDTTGRGMPELQSRALVLKVNRLLRF